MKWLYIEEIDSTNKYAKEGISTDNISDQTVVYTYRQTAGRGRLQREWNYTGEDNIYASIVLKPSGQMKEVYSNLTQLLCVVLAEVFEEYSVVPKIKWPNDIRINGKKISGILAEAVTSQEGNLLGIVLGFGVNLNVPEELLEKINQPATSLNIETGMFIDKEEFLKKVIDKFCLYYNKFIEEGFLLIREDYKKRAEFLNKNVSVKVFDKTYEGIATDVTSNGALKLKDKNNKEHILLIGDIL
jgi:BirA family biotin operon repressor/biotin-[acetyl-CoA-carboxylase] ligase